MSNTAIRTLIIDDSALYRKFVASVLKEIPDVEVVGTATNGRIGLEKIRSLQPDLITLDLEMPELDGLDVLRELAKREIEVASIVVSSTTDEGAKATNMALQLGAFDFVLKPNGESPEDSRRHLGQALAPKIQAIVDTLHRKTTTSRPMKPVVSDEIEDGTLLGMAKGFGSTRPEPAVVGVGVSTGGPVALNRFLPMLAADFPCPILLVQHMPPMFTKSLADDLNRKCALTVEEATDGAVAEAGQVLIAPGGAQMRIVKMNGRPTVQITNDPPERSCKPSVDYLFRSLAHHYGDRAVAVILTGMGDDGTLGCKLMKRAGALIITQDEATSVVYGMPRSVVEAGMADRVAPLDDIAGCLMAVSKRGAIA